MACDKFDNILLDEDNLAQNLSGTLTFSDGSSLSQIIDSLSLSSISESSLPTPISESPRVNINIRKSLTDSYEVKFEVINTDIVGENKSKHVEYSILLMKTSGLDSMPAKIIKRYTELNSLRRDLYYLEPDLIKCIPFPSKRLIGNFTSETLLERSRAFENLLTHVFSCKKLRYSRIFVDFLYGIDAMEGYRLIENGLYEKAADLLICCWKVQSKIHPNKSIHCTMMLIGIVACYCALNANEKVNIFADLAIQSFTESSSVLLSSTSTSSLSTSSSSFVNETSPLSMPSSPLIKASYETWLIALLRTNIKVCATLGKEKRSYEHRLLQLQNNGYSIEQTESLLEMILHNKKLWINLVLGDGSNDLIMGRGSF